MSELGGSSPGPPPFPPGLSASRRQSIHGLRLQEQEHTGSCSKVPFFGKLYLKNSAVLKKPWHLVQTGICSFRSSEQAGPVALHVTSSQMLVTLDGWDIDSPAILFPLPADPGLVLFTNTITRERWPWAWPWLPGTLTDPVACYLLCLHGRSGLAQACWAGPPKMERTGWWSQVGLGTSGGCGQRGCWEAVPGWPGAACLC